MNFCTFAPYQYNINIMDLKVIKEIRRSKKIKLNDLSKRTGLRVDRLSRIESGDVSPSIEVVDMVLREMGYRLTISVMD